MDITGPVHNLGAYHSYICIHHCEYPSALSSVGLARSLAMLAFYVGLLKVLWTSGGDLTFYKFPFLRLLGKYPWPIANAVIHFSSLIHISIKQIFPQQTFEVVTAPTWISLHSSVWYLYSPSLPISTIMGPYLRVWKLLFHSAVAFFPRASLNPRRFINQ